MKTIVVRVFPAALLGAVACGARPPGGRSMDRIAPDVLSIPYGSGVTIDGDVDADEWAAAARVQFQFANVYGDSVTGTILLLHDDVSLHVAWLFDPWDHDVYYAPELFLDTDNDRSSTLQANDWWFHVSGSDCAASGRYADYSTCTKNADWQTGPAPASCSCRRTWASIRSEGGSLCGRPGVASTGSCSRGSI